MIDSPFRGFLEKTTRPVVGFLVRQKVHPNTLTWLSFFISTSSCYFLLIDYDFLALAVWWIGRLFDGLDGLVARAARLQSKRGGFLDISLDMLAYSLVAFGFLWRSEFDVLWALVLVGYVMCITTALALGEMGNALDNRSLKLATGLAEAGETGLFYSLVWLFPAYEFSLLLLWLALLTVTVAARFLSAYQKEQL